jgi:hypothetical protein
MSGLEDIPLIGGIAETAIHGAEAVGDAVEGDWDGAAHEAFNMAGSALHTAADVATDGAFSAVEGVYDAAAPALGLPTSDDISHTIEHGVQDAGNALGDAAYNLMNPSDDSGLGDGGLGGGDFGDGGLGDGGLGDGGGLGGGDMGGDPGMDAGGGDYGDGGGDGGYDMGGGDGGAEY